jgi:hypothetical protein
VKTPCEAAGGFEKVEVPGGKNDETRAGGADRVSDYDLTCLAEAAKP